MAEKRRRATDRRNTGLPLSMLNNALIVVALAISTALIATTYQTNEGYQSLQRATERYIACQAGAVEFQAGSDYLTNEARYFVLTGDATHAQNYTEEVEVTRRRERAMEEIDDFLEEEQSYAFLTHALEHSYALVEVECRAMRLAADTWACDLSLLPELIREAQPEPALLSLDAEEKKAAAVEMLFGEAYHQSKSSIYDNVEKSIRALIDNTRAQQIASGERLNGQLRRQQALTAVLLGALFLVVVSTYLLIIKPLMRSVRLIRAHQRILAEGSYEMRFLADTYNEMFDQQARFTERLAYSATHDSLTGLYNRAAYDAMREDAGGEEDVGVLMIDVDKFKTYNDRYGHAVGDAVLKKVAQVLRESFRAEDFIGRIGGDEFCVVMVRVGSAMEAIVREKIERANRRLQNTQDGLPSISLSVGVAFGDRSNPTGDIYKDADTALYRAKNAGRGLCAFYDSPVVPEGGAVDRAERTKGR